jgi:signal transduction histidine kinase
VTQSAARASVLDVPPRVSRVLAWLAAPGARRVAARHAIALVLALAAIALVNAVSAPLGRAFFFGAFPPILVAGLVAGAGPGILATLVCSAAFSVEFLHPAHALVMTRDPRDLVRIAGFTVSAALVAWVGGALRAALAREHDARVLAVAAAEEIARGDQYRADLVRMLSHDVRTPLTVVVNQAFLARRRATTPEELRSADIVSTSAQRIAAMIDDLVDAMNLETGKLSLAPCPVDFAEFARELKERLADALPVERVEVELSPGLPPVEADPNRLERIVVNLLANALKYAPEPTPVRLRAAPAGGEVLISVGDHGPGIAPEDLPHIFDRFYRSASVRGTEGLGLGLYICRKLVDAHGGRIWVESHASGSEFHVALPAAPDGGRSASAAMS